MRLIILMLALMLCGPAFGQNNFSYNTFEKIPVQHEGRIKPLDSFAKNMLQIFNGSDSIKGMVATQWLAETLFDPATALTRPVFRIFKPRILNLPEGSRYFSYADLAPALGAKAEIIQRLAQTEPAKWGADQAELMRLQEASILYAQLLRSFSLLLPLNLEVPESLQKDLTGSKHFTMQDYARNAGALQKRLQDIVQKKGSDPAKYTQSERDVALFAFHMQTMEAGGQNNVLFRVVPGAWGDDASSTWFSPWALAQVGQASEQGSAYLNDWKAMALAYINGDAAAWDSSVKTTYEASKSFAAPQKTLLELVYNKGHVISLSLVLYFCALLFFSASALHGAKFWPLLCTASAVLGCFVHGIAIALRIIILERPPVGTLYESILFVAFICVLCGLIFEYIRRDKTGILSAIVCGIILLFIAQSFAGADTMHVLVAVLNTNFWLATHVLCITIGYAWCLFAAFLAHIWLYKMARGHVDADRLVRPVKTIALIALLFTATGTILGGIWADQSWGRFWGWDPKENGALLIVLWLIWVLHAKIAGQVSERVFMAAMAALSIIVGLAWFGVNLLNVGLHSYGFISGVAAALGGFCALEMSVIWFLHYKGQSRAQ